ncbi:MAG TPA: hypothetical protein VK892_00290 [Pyrinomonadaceae bacterium]|nr:hypothetical protein [Pyrinomonadaceae bacterium]
MSGEQTRRSFFKVMTVEIKIEEGLMAEICEAADFEQKSCSEYINSALRAALQNTERKRREPEAVRRFKESYEKFPQELDDSDEEWEYWRKQYEKFERSEK